MLHFPDITKNVRVIQGKKKEIPNHRNLLFVISRNYFLSETSAATVQAAMTAPKARPQTGPPIIESRGASDCSIQSFFIFVRDSFPVTPVDTPHFPRRQQRSAEAYNTCLTKDEWDRRNRPGGDHGTGGTVPVGTMGEQSCVNHVHPHKFRRTMATAAIDKGMPIEQVQRLLGHEKIDTTLHYAMVKQNNVKLSHKKYIG